MGPTILSGSRSTSSAHHDAVGAALHHAQIQILVLLDGGCKSGVGDVAIGAASLIAQYNGTEKASHIKDKLVEMTQLNEQLYCAGIASPEGCGRR